MIRRSIVNDCGYFSEDPEMVAFEDYHLWLRIVRCGRWRFDPRPLAKYHKSNDRISKDDFAIDIKKKRAVFRSLKTMIENHNDIKLIDEKLNEIRKKYLQHAVTQRDITMVCNALFG